VSASTLRLRPGEAFGPFRVLAELGRGAAGTVWHVHDAAGRELALKILLRPENELALQRFQREGEITARLAHSGIVRVHAGGVIQGWPYLAYELVSGTTFDAFASDASPEAVLRSLVQVARAVGHAHTQGVVHRDLKPSNVLIDAAGNVRVADFGAASAVGLERLTLSGVTVGTPQFMAPEQLTGERDSWGPGVDVWALGVMLHWSLAKRYPFPADTLVALVAQVLSTKATALRKHDPTVAPAVEAVCLRALRTEPSERYADANAFADDLESALGATVRGRRSRRWALLPLVALGLALAWGTSGSAHEQAPDTSGSAPAVGPGSAISAHSRLRALLEQTLSALPSEVAQRRLESDAFDPLERDAGAQRILDEAYRARCSALEARLGATPRDGDVCDELRALRAIAVQLDHREAPARLLDALLGWALREVRGGGDLPLASLEAAVRHGGRVSEHGLGLELRERTTVLKGFKTVTPADLGRLFLALARLDASLGLTSVQLDYSAYAPQGEGPWEVYMRLRLSPALPKSLTQLHAILRQPLQGLDLGPTQWAETACLVAPGLEPGEGVALLVEARARDPDSPEVARSLTLLLLREGRVREAADEARRGHPLFVASGSVSVIGARADWVSMHVQLVHSLVGAKQRDEARVAYARVHELSREVAADLAASFPWLEGGE